jgi:hypothetical protein
MSLWSQSLSWCIDNADGNPEKIAKCIFKHLAMPVPRSWWENALEENRVRYGFAHMLHDFCNELLNLPDLAEDLDYSLLVALAFIEDKGFGISGNQFSLQEYVNEAKKILKVRPELDKLGKKIEQIIKKEIRSLLK